MGPGRALVIKAETAGPTGRSGVRSGSDSGAYKGRQQCQKDARRLKHWNVTRLAQGSEPSPSVLDVSLFLATVLLRFALVVSARGIALLVLGPAIYFFGTSILFRTLVGVPALLALLRLIRGQGSARKCQNCSCGQKARSPTTESMFSIDHLAFSFSLD